MRVNPLNLNASSSSWVGIVTGREKRREPPLEHVPLEMLVC